MENKTIEYILTKPFQVGKGGDFIDAEIIKITEPVYRDIHKANILQQQFLITLNKNKNETKANNDVGIDDIKGKDLYMALAMGGANLELCINTLKELLKTSAFVNGDIKITETILTQISIQDFNLILGEYLKSFLLGDLMN